MSNFWGSLQRDGGFSLSTVFPALLCYTGRNFRGGEALTCWLRRAVTLMAAIHDRILTRNDGFPAVLTDKQLHFLVVGVCGMLLFFAVHLLFSSLIRRGWALLVSWIYVFTLILVITVGIEFGQKLSGTGSMELADALFGILGFLALFAVFYLLRGLFTRAGRK